MKNNIKTYSNREKLEMERRVADEMVDEEIAHLLEQEWEKGDFTKSILHEDDKELLYAKISSRIFENKDDNIQNTESDRKSIFLKKMGRYAAAILLPVIAAVSFYVYNTTHKATEAMTIVRTERGERTTVTLPDGTVVNINSASVLSYSHSSFAEGKRVVDFEGEAFFTVISDPSHPFEVKTGDVSVNVLGTEFNVFSCKNFEDISVFLIKGRVEMKCDGVADAIQLKPWQKAIFDKRNKEIEVINTDSSDSDISWLNNELTFTDEPLKDVINKIEISYGVKFETQSIAYLSQDRFTGTVPMDDLSTVINILEDVYDVKFTIKDKKIEVGS